MTFLNPGLLWFLLAAAAPIVIHLLNRRRHKTVQWAAMAFLLKATRESRGKKRLRHILVLACRALAVAALATAASLPVVSSLLGFGGGRPDLIVVVFDRSASMEANPRGGAVPRREIALQRLRDALAELGGSRIVLVDSATGSTQEIATPEVLGDLSATAATDTAADLPALLGTAAAFLGENPGRSEVWVVSDLQASSWRPEDDRWTAARAALAALPEPPQLRVLSLSGESAENQAVRLLASRRSGDQLLLDLEIVRSVDATTPLNLPVTTTVDGVRSTESVTIPGQSLRLRKTVALPKGATSGFGSLSIPGDGNPRDNAAFFAYGPATPTRTAVVAAPGEAASYLALAAAPPGFAGQEAVSVALGQLGTLDLSSFAAVLWAAPLPVGPDASQIIAFLESGGQAIFFAPPDESAQPFLDLAWSPLERAAPDSFFILGSWDREDGLLRDGIDGSPLPAERFRAIQRRLPVGEAAVLARWDDEQPFLSRRILGRGTAWFVGTLPDYGWSNLGDADVLLPAVQRAVLAGADRLSSPLAAELGSSAAKPAPGENRTRLDEFAAGPRSDPDHLAGVFRLGDRVLALNRPAAEDRTDVLDPAALDPLLEGLRFSLFEDRSQGANENVTRGVWRAFLVAMLFLLLAEAALCLPKRPAPKPALA